MGKLEILCGALGIVFLGAGLTIALTLAMEAWKADAHVRGLWWSALAAVTVLAGIVVGTLPMAYKADEGTPKVNPDDIATLDTFAFKARVLEAWKPMIVDVTIKNYGKAPAINFKHIGTMVFTEKPMDMNPTADALRKMEGKNGPDIFPEPQAVLPFQSNQILTIDQATAIQDGFLNVYIVGRWTYSDRTKQLRVKEFCGRFEHQSKRFEFCAGYNPKDS